MDVVEIDDISIVFSIGSFVGRSSVETVVFCIVVKDLFDAEPVVTFIAISEKIVDGSGGSSVVLLVVASTAFGNSVDNVFVKDFIFIDSFKFDSVDNVDGVIVTIDMTGEAAAVREISSAFVSRELVVGDNALDAIVVCAVFSVLVDVKSIASVSIDSRDLVGGINVDGNSVDTEGVMQNFVFVIVVCSALVVGGIDVDVVVSAVSDDSVCGSNVVFVVVASTIVGSFDKKVVAGDAIVIVSVVFTSSLDSVVEMGIISFFVSRYFVGASDLDAIVFCTVVSILADTNGVFRSVFSVVVPKVSKFGDVVGGINVVSPVVGNSFDVEAAVKDVISIGVSVDFDGSSSNNVVDFATIFIVSVDNEADVRIVVVCRDVDDGGRNFVSISGEVSSSSDDNAVVKYLIFIILMTNSQTLSIFYAHVNPFCKIEATWPNCNSA